MAAIRASDNYMRAAEACVHVHARRRAGLGCVRTPPQQLQDGADLRPAKPARRSFELPWPDERDELGDAGRELQPADGKRERR